MPSPAQPRPATATSIGSSRFASLFKRKQNPSGLHLDAPAMSDLASSARSAPLPPLAPFFIGGSPIIRSSASSPHATTPRSSPKKDRRASPLHNPHSSTPPQSPPRPLLSSIHQNRSYPPYRLMCASPVAGFDGEVEVKVEEPFSPLQDSERFPTTPRRERANAQVEAEAWQVEATAGLAISIADARPKDRLLPPAPIRTPSETSVPSFISLGEASEPPTSETAASLLELQRDEAYFNAKAHGLRLTVLPYTAEPSLPSPSFTMAETEASLTPSTAFASPFVAAPGESPLFDVLDMYGEDDSPRTSDGGEMERNSRGASWGATSSSGPALSIPLSLANSSPVSPYPIEHFNKATQTDYSFLSTVHRLNAALDEEKAKREACEQRVRKLEDERALQT